MPSNTGDLLRLRAKTTSCSETWVDPVGTLPRGTSTGLLVGTSAKERVPLAEAIFLELAVSKSVLGLPLGGTLVSGDSRSGTDLLLKSVLGAHGGELLGGGGLDGVAGGDVVEGSVVGLVLLQARKDAGNVCFKQQRLTNRHSEAYSEAPGGELLGS